MTIEIVQLDETNATCLGALAPDVFDNPVDPVQLGRFLSDPGLVMMVAIESGLVVDVASAVECFHPDKSPQLWINEVGVSPAYQRRGIGRTPDRSNGGIWANHGCVAGWLGTDEANVAAQACFAGMPVSNRPRSFCSTNGILRFETRPAPCALDMVWAVAESH